MTQNYHRNPPPEVEDSDPGATPLAARVIGGDRLTLFKQQIARGWKRLPTDAEMEMMALYFESGHYDPWARPPQLIFTLRWDTNAGGDVLTPQKTIDGLRLDAARSRDFLGQVGPYWCGDDGVWVDIWLRKEPPRAARVGVRRRGNPDPTWSTALYDEWVQKDKAGNPTSFWRDKPAHMLAKTAESMSLKRATPTETDPVAQEHMRQLERLAMPQAAEAYARIYGDKDHSPYDLPAYIPTRERDVDDRPRLVDRASGEVLEAQPQQPALGDGQPRAGSPKREWSLGELLEEYGSLLSTCRTEGAVPEGEVSAYLFAEGQATREKIVAQGASLRTRLAAHRNRATMDHAQEVEYPTSADDDEELAIAEGQAEDEDIDAQLPLGEAASSKVDSVHDDGYQQLAAAILEAAQFEVAYDDCRIELPCSRDELNRKLTALTFRIRMVKDQRTEQAQRRQTVS